MRARWRGRSRRRALLIVRDAFTGKKWFGGRDAGLTHAPRGLLF